MALHLAREGAPTVEWLADAHGVPLSLVDSFLYPGHSKMRMHGTPNRTGSELMGALHQAAERLSIDIITDAPTTHLFADGDGRVHGVRITRPDGSVEDIGCEALILACCGFGGSRELLQRYIPEILEATFFGHPGNKGDALRWGTALGAAAADIHAYQGHGGLAYGQGVPILWAHIIRGGFQVNADGRRFSNEARGYSEQAVDIVAQPGHFAWSIFDERIHEAMKEFDDYQDAIKADCIRHAADADELCRVTGLPATLKQTLADVHDYATGRKADPSGRDFSIGQPLAAPYKAVKVSGALFHTQGGLVVDRDARVLRADTQPLPNLYAGGGAARGISGPSCWGYLAGNGLLTATAFGRLAGRAAARQVTGKPE
jgi:fumarate reductase flavoprotein subunit